MRKLIFSLGAGVSIFGCTHSALAVNYHFGDLLLIFRSAGNNDVEFDLGSVSNFLSLPSGTVQTVSGWSASTVLSNRSSGTLSGDVFILLATAGQPNPTQQSSEADFLSGPGFPLPTDISQSLFAGQSSLITTVGTNMQLYTSASAGNSAVISPGDPRSFTKLASGGLTDPSKLGGESTFNVQTAIPGAARLYQVDSVNGANPPSATWAGTFSIDANNVLSYTAGATLPSAVNLSIVNNNDGSVSVSFPSITGINYELLTSPTVIGPINGPLSQWGSTPTGHTLGTGGVVTFLDFPNTADAFYEVQSY